MKLWRHVIINTRCSWLHGDSRGFRSRDHRIHSSGDYEAPPPADEHRALWLYHLGRSVDPVEFSRSTRVVVVAEFVLKSLALEHRIIACSCGAEHLHALAELPADDNDVKREVGKCKQKVSHVLRESMPGSIWSAGGEYKRIRGKSHLHNTYDYIRTMQEPETIVWSHRDGEDWIADPSIGYLMIDESRKLIRVSEK